MYLACRVGITWAMVETGDFAGARRRLRLYSFHFANEVERIESLKALFSQSSSGDAALWSHDDGECYHDEEYTWMDDDFADDDGFGFD